MIFRNPWVLILIPFVLSILFLMRRKRDAPGLRFPNHELCAGIKETFRVKFYRNLIYLRVLALILLLFAIAGPQAVTKETKVIREGIDIMLCVDVSTSMLAEDIHLDTQRKNRIETAKDVIKDFVGMRKDDRIGMVVFALNPYLLAPLTLDHGWLRQNLERLEVGIVEDGTAIGSGLLSAMNKIGGREAREKIVILLTDGRNNAGDIPPLAAAEAAKALRIKIYTIGVGSKGAALYPVPGPFGKTIYRSVAVDLDEETLRAIASKTGAAYFRATDAEGLRKVYREIDKLEKQKIEEKIYYTYEERYPPFLIAGLLLLLLELFLKNTVLRRLP